eukprot:Pgem_evm1s16032
MLILKLKMNKELRGSIYLEPTTRVTNGSVGNDTDFNIHKSNRIYKIRCQDKEERDTWVKEINKKLTAINKEEYEKITNPLNN